MSIELLRGLLEDSIEDIADLPSFKPFPAGAHTCTIKFEQKEVNDNAGIVVTFTLVETQEQDNPDETPATAGDTCSVFCALQGTEDQVKFGKGRLKEILVPLGEHLGKTDSFEIMEDMQNAEVAIVSTTRMGKDDNGKKDPSKLYFQLKGLVVL